MANSLSIAIKLVNEAKGELDRLSADLGHVEGAARKAGTGFDSAGRSAKDAGGHVGVFSGFLREAAATAAGFVIGQGLLRLPGFLSSSVAGASDLQESLSKSRVVFGESSAAIEAWSKTAAEAFGQSQNQALQAAGTFGNFFNTLGVGRNQAAGMSQRLVELAGDFASFHNVDPSEVITAFGSALRGENEPVSRFGVLLNDATLKQKALELGMISSVKDGITPAQKALAAYHLLLEQSGNAQGDFARTASGNANQLRILQAQFANLKTELGEALLPVIVRAGRVLVETLPVAMQLTGRAIDGVRPFFQSLARWVGEETPEAFNTLSRVVGTVMVGILETISAVGQAIYTALQWINPFAPHSPPLVDQVRDGVALIRDEYASLAGVEGDLSVVEGAVRRFEEAMASTAATLADGDLQGKLDDIARTGGSEAAAAFREAHDALDELNREYEDMGAAIATAQAAFDGLDAKLDAEKTKLGELGNALDDAKAKLRGFQTADIAEAKPFDDKLDGLDTQMKQLQLQIAKAKQQGPLEIVGADGKRHLTAAGQAVEALEGQLEKLRLQAEQTRLEKDLAIDPLKQKLGELGQVAPKPFAEIFKGAQDAQDAINRLGPEFDAQSATVAKTQTEYEKAKATLDAQKESYKALGDAIRTQTSSLDQYAQVAAKVVQQEEARVKAAEAAAKSASANAGGPGNFGSALEGIAATAAEVQGATDKVGESFAKLGEKVGEAKRQFERVKREFQETRRELAPIEAAIRRAFDDPDTIRAIAIAIGVVTGAVIALNVAMAVNPFVLLAVAAVALVAGIAFLALKWDELVAKYPAIASVNDAVREKWDEFKAWITDEFWPRIKETFDNIVSTLTFVKDHWEQIKNAITPIVQAHLAVVQLAFDTMRNHIETVMYLVLDVINIVMALIRGDWEGAWNGMKKFVSDLWDGIKTDVENGINLVKNLWPLMKAAGEAIGGALKDGFQAGLEGALGLAADIANAVIGLFETAINWIITKVNDAIPNDIGFSIAGKSFTYDIDDNPIGQVSIPRFAQGGFVGEPTLGIVGDVRGGEFIIPANSGVGHWLGQMLADMGGVGAGLQASREQAAAAFAAAAGVIPELGVPTGDAADSGPSGFADRPWVPGGGGSASGGAILSMGATNHFTINVGGNMSRAEKRKLARDLADEIDSEVGRKQARSHTISRRPSYIPQ